MTSPHPDTNHPNNPTLSSQPVTTPPDPVSGKYRNPNIGESTCLYDVAVYILSYEGCAWPARQSSNGILGVYNSLKDAQQAGTRWLRDRSDHSGAGSTERRFSEWEIDEDTREWTKGRAESGLGFLESRVVRIKMCEVKTESRFAEGGKKDGGGS